MQALSGTGACRLMAEFQHRYMPKSTVLIPKPTWSNHHNIWRDARVPAQEFRSVLPAISSLSLRETEKIVVNIRSISDHAGTTGSGTTSQRRVASTTMACSRTSRCEL